MCWPLVEQTQRETVHSPQIVLDLKNCGIVALTMVHKWFWNLGESHHRYVTNRNLDFVVHKLLDFSLQLPIANMMSKWQPNWKVGHFCKPQVCSRELLSVQNHKFLLCVSPQTSIFTCFIYGKNTLVFTLATDLWCAKVCTYTLVNIDTNQHCLKGFSSPQQMKHCLPLLAPFCKALGGGIIDKLLFSVSFIFIPGSIKFIM